MIRYQVLNRTKYLDPSSLTRACGFAPGEKEDLLRTYVAEVNEMRRIDRIYGAICDLMVAEKKHRDRLVGLKDELSVLGGKYGGLGWPVSAAALLELDIRELESSIRILAAMRDEVKADMSLHYGEVARCAALLEAGWNLHPKLVLGLKGELILESAAWSMDDVSSLMDEDPGD